MVLPDSQGTLICGWPFSHLAFAVCTWGMELWLAPMRPSNFRSDLGNTTRFEWSYPLAYGGLNIIHVWHVRKENSCARMRKAFYKILCCIICRV